MWINAETLTVHKRSQTERVCAVSFQLCEVQKQAKVILDNRNQNTGHLWAQNTELGMFLVCIWVVGICAYSFIKMHEALLCLLSIKRVV